VSVLGPPRLRFEPLKLLNFDFFADPYPAFYSNAVSDLDLKNADSGSGSATLVSVKVWISKFIALCQDVLAPDFLFLSLPRLAWTLTCFFYSDLRALSYAEKTA
jgi:hypothetical protein